MSVLSTVVTVLAFAFQLSSGIITFVPTINIANGNGRRRLQNENGEVIDPVCVRTMELVRGLSELGEILWQPGNGNANSVVKAAEELLAACMEDAEEDNESQMGQCVFYVQTALEMDIELLESVWIFAYGDNTELHRGCGKVVTAVNENMRRRAEVEIEAVNGVESFVRKDSHVARRLLGAASAVAVGTGVVLGHICRNFNPTTFDVLA